MSQTEDLVGSWRVSIRYREALPESITCSSILAAWLLIEELEANQSVSQVRLFRVEEREEHIYHSYRNGATGVIEPWFSQHSERLKALLIEAREQLAKQPRARLSGLAG